MSELQIHVGGTPLHEAAEAGVLWRPVQEGPCGLVGGPRGCTGLSGSRELAPPLKLPGLHSGVHHLLRVVVVCLDEGSLESCQVHVRVLVLLHEGCSSFSCVAWEVGCSNQKRGMGGCFSADCGFNPPSDSRFVQSLLGCLKCRLPLCTEARRCMDRRGT